MGHSTDLTSFRRRYQIGFFFWRVEGRGGLLSGHDELPRMTMFCSLPPKVVKVECSRDAYLLELCTGIEFVDIAITLVNVRPSTDLLTGRPPANPVVTQRK
jgi:hypothetical protein